MSSPPEATSLNHVEIRRSIVSSVRRELLGPATSDEILSQRPEDMYVLGGLAPSGSQLTEEDTEEERAGTVEESAAETDMAYGGMKQSAIGLTVVIPSSASAPLEFTVTYGTYDRHLDAAGPPRWQRHEYKHSQTWLPKAADIGSTDLAEGAALDWRARTRGNDIFLTLSLINRNESGRGRRRYLFQPVIAVRSTDPAQAPFIEGSRSVIEEDDADRESDRLLYREVREYAAGHGCAAVWKLNENGQIVEICTEQLPQYELPAVLPLEQTSAMLEMESLALMSGNQELADSIKPLVDEYEVWIREQSDRVSSLATEYQETARHHLDECREVARRMLDGLGLIASDERVADAFRQANAAMALQRRQSVIATQFRETGRRIDFGEAPKWRPFQLAFFLINIRSLADPTSDEVGITDLLWFPTGGGKTEAYLGLTAFTLFMRRQGLAVPDTDYSVGTAVIMRYTLRLLTTQQFERAAILICACEVLRREDPERWGHSPFTIGMWVGQATTPNRYETAVDALAEIDSGTRPLKDHPFVLRNCPWCGERLDRQSFNNEPQDERISICCPRNDCEFCQSQGGLPVLVVDDEIYRRPPSMILGTVDKFARMPWVPEASSLFGRATFQCSKHGMRPDRSCLNRSCRVTALESPIAPPSLIIQDELHLISGPLGSLVGLYETAVEFLASREIDNVYYSPKIVASTATIRRAAEQIRGLFARDVRLFPPPALDPFESHFARRVTSDEQPGRLFLGLCAFGRSSKTMQVRLYSTLLRAIYPYRNNPELADAYWTLVGYYNSLPQLGGAVSLVQDDIQTRLRSLREIEGEGRVIERHDEVTSRVPSTQIPEKLAEMQSPLSSGQALDIMLASNMISVGLDVGRLGLMVINSQPKTTSEYIQAASRIGREHPGLVVIAYNWTAPRDLSHFEHFLTYHQTLYRHVEATSVTPFSPRARDRALHAVLYTMLRLIHPQLVPRDSANSFSQTKYPPKDLVDFFIRRAGLASDSALSDEKDQLEVAREIRYLIDTWEQGAANPNMPLIFDQTHVFRKSRRSTKIPLMIPAGSNIPISNSVTLPTLNSLRDVEEETEWRRI